MEISNQIRRLRRKIFNKFLYVKEKVVWIRKSAKYKHLSFSKSLFGLGSLLLVRKISSLNPRGKTLDALLVKLQQLFVRTPSSISEPDMLRVCITYQCNKNCSFCYSEMPKNEFKQHMSLDDFKFLLKWAKTQGWERLRLLGGEPTVHPDFNAMLAMLRQEGFAISFSTNGLFQEDFTPLFRPTFVRGVNFSYPQKGASAKEEELFLRNLEKTVKRRVHIVVSWIVYPEGNGWHKVVELAKKYRPQVMLRFSMLLFNAQGGIHSEQAKKDFHQMSRHLVEIARYAHKSKVNFYFYRPILRCMFTQEELRFFESISPFVYYTRCPINLGSDCVCSRVTINPDLSYYPCPVIFTKAERLTEKTTREDLNRSFKQSTMALCLKPLMEECQSCRYFENYKKSLLNKNTDLADKDLCQGGCLGFKL